jgi:hypothetical protein
VLRCDGDPVGWVEDRLVLLVPANAVVLVCVVAEQLDDLAAPGGWPCSPRASIQSPTCALLVVFAVLMVIIEPFG